MGNEQYIMLEHSKGVPFQTPEGRTGTVTASFNANDFLNEFDKSIVLNRYSPVLQKRIGGEYQNNIAITGKFRTNCNASAADINGAFSFINVRKNSSGKASAYSGYGFAWRVSRPEHINEIEITGNPSISISLGTGYYDIPIATDPEADNNLMYLVYGETKTYVPFNYTSYDSSSGKLLGCYIPNIAPMSTHKLCYMSANIYICDNDPVHGDMYASRYVIDPLTGLSYIQAGTCIIEPNTNYWFKIVISGNNAVSVYLREDDEPFEEADMIIYSGATTTMSEHLNSEGMDSFGISVYDTCGYQWWYDNIKISKLGGEYAVAYFSFDVMDMPEDLQVELSAYGTSVSNGVKVYVRDHSGAGKWDTILAASVSDYTVMVTNIISKTAYSHGGQIDIMLTTLAPSTITTPSALYIDYIKVVRAMVSGVHMGGCVDVYIDDQGAVISEYVDTVAPDTSSIAFDGRGNISSIEVGGVDLVYAVDYVIMEADPSYSNSILSHPIIKFTSTYIGETATIKYWASNVVPSVQALIDSDAHRPLGLNVLVKHKRVHEIRIIPENEATYSMVDGYVRALEYNNGKKTISYTDLSKYIYGETGAYQDVALSIKSYDGNRMKHRTISLMGQEYSIDDTETFRIMK